MIGGHVVHGLGDAGQALDQGRGCLLDLRLVRGVDVLELLALLVTTPRLPQPAERVAKLGRRPFQGNRLSVERRSGGLELVGVYVKAVASHAVPPPWLWTRNASRAADMLRLTDGDPRIQH